MTVCHPIALEGQHLFIQDESIVTDMGKRKGVCAGLAVYESLIIFSDKTVAAIMQKL
jgi:hypothetical protein